MSRAGCWRVEPQFMQLIIHFYPSDPIRKKIIMHLTLTQIGRNEFTSPPTTSYIIIVITTGGGFLLIYFLEYI